MEGKTSNFEKVLADFEAKLAKAEYVAIDTELTGVDVEGETDTFDECAATRLGKICRVAERYTLIQLGLTLVGPVTRQDNGQEGRLFCASYNIFAFPYVSNELRHDPVFMCQAAALRFNAQHRVDFNTWIGQGVPYMTREEERQLKAEGYREEDLEQKVGLLRLWKALCAARLPFVVHNPLDLFFLLVAFERRPLPRGDPRELAMLIRQCTPKVYDTAHLHGAVGRFRRLGLAKFFEDAKERHAELLKDSSRNGVQPVEFELQGETAVRYSKPAEQMAHEAGFDSLMTAQLFAYLRAISPMRIKEAGNRLFLYRSIEFIDIDRAALEGVVGQSMFDLSRVTLLVAALDPTAIDTNEVPRQIAAASAEYKWMDGAHILVVIRSSGGAAIRKAAEVAAKVHGVESWMPFENWREMQAREAESARCALRQKDEPIEAAPFTSPVVPASSSTTSDVVRTPLASPSAAADNGNVIVQASASSSPAKSEALIGIAMAEMDRQRWILFLRAAGGGFVSGVLFLLAVIRMRRRWSHR